MTTNCRFDRLSYYKLMQPKALDDIFREFFHVSNDFHVFQFSFFSGFFSLLVPTAESMQSKRCRNFCFHLVAFLAAMPSSPIHNGSPGYVHHFRYIHTIHSIGILMLLLSLVLLLLLLLFSICFTFGISFW